MLLINQSTQPERKFHLFNFKTLFRAACLSLSMGALVSCVTFPNETVSRTLNSQYGKASADVEYWRFLVCDSKDYSKTEAGWAVTRGDACATMLRVPGTRSRMNVPPPQLDLILAGYLLTACREYTKPLKAKALILETGCGAYFSSIIRIQETSPSIVSPAIRSDAVALARAVCTGKMDLGSVTQTEWGCNQASKAMRALGETQLADSMSAGLCIAYGKQERCDEARRAGMSVPTPATIASISSRFRDQHNEEVEIQDEGFQQQSLQMAAERADRRELFNTVSTALAGIAQAPAPWNGASTSANSISFTESLKPSRSIGTNGEALIHRASTGGAGAASLSPGEFGKGTDAKSCVRLDFHDKGNNVVDVSAKNTCGFEIKVVVCRADNSRCHNDQLRGSQGGSLFDADPSGNSYVYAACKAEDTFYIVKPGTTYPSQHTWTGSGPYLCWAP